MERFDLVKFDDSVDRFFKGQMSEEEERQFMDMVSANPELKDRLDVIAVMKKAMHEIRMDETRNICAEIEGMGEKEYRLRTGLAVRKARIWPKIIRYAVAACVVGIIAAVGWQLIKPDPYKKLGESYDYYAYNSSVDDTMRGDEMLSADDISYISGLFANVEAGKDLDNTITRLNELLPKVKAEDSAIIDALSWNLAIAYLKQGDGDAAKTVLSDMIERNRALYPGIASTAQSLLDEINKIDN